MTATSTDNPMAAVRRSFEILRCFSPESPWLSHGEIAARAGIPKATMTRLARTLTELGYLTYDARTRRYALGAATVPLGQGYLKAIDVREIARPLMQRLCREINANVHLGVRSGLEIMMVESCLVPPSFALMRVGVGSTMPIETHSMGRAYLAAASQAEREEIFGLLEKRYGHRWPVLRQRLLEAVAEYRKQGYSTSFGEWRSDQNGVAVAIPDPSTGALFAINCGGAAFHLGEEYLRKTAAPKLLALSRHVVRKWKGGASASRAE